MASQKSARLTWTGNELDLLVTSPGGYQYQMSPPADDASPTPMEYLLASAAGCTAMDVIAILRKKRQPLQSFDIEVEATQADEHPHVYTVGTITFIIKGAGVDPKAVERAIDLSQEKYCSASIMLKRAGMDLKTAFRIEAE